jgi:glutathione synthase/RimK-type ligase-like ATP-grasp enzyme
MARVLVTYGWCRTSYVVARSLVAHGHEVYACSSLRPIMTAWSRLTRAGAVVRDPFSQPEAFSRDVADLVRRWRIDAVFPGHEDALALRRYEALLPAGVVLACPPLDALLAAVDKGVTTRTALSAGLDVPTTAFPEHPDEAVGAADAIGYPVVLKLRRSNGGKGVVVAHDADEVRSAFTGPWAGIADRPGHVALVQRFVRGAVVGACFMANDGDPVAVYGERYLRTKDGGFGTSTYRAPEPSPPLLEATARLIGAIGWSGIGHVDFIEERDTGRFLFLELNPRPWGAIHLAVTNGFHFPAAALAHALGESDLQRFFPPDRDLGQRHSLWPVGEGIRLVHQMRQLARGRAPEERPTQRRGVDWRETRLDGLAWDDPLPFVAESLCYLAAFVRAGGDLNPATEGMLEAPDALRSRGDATP